MNFLPQTQASLQKLEKKKIYDDLAQKKIYIYKKIFYNIILEKIN